MLKVPSTLAQGLGKHISHFCDFSLGSKNNYNQCAHYVSHVLGYSAPVTCKNLTYADKQLPGTGAAIRVNDLFTQSKSRGPLARKPATLTSCLLFVTISSNVKTFGNELVMGNHPRKHVGILDGGKVWNYSNTQNKVVADVLSAFQAKFKLAYKTAGQTVEFYYGAP